MECRCEAARAGAAGPAPARGVQVERKQGCRACRGRARETAQKIRGDRFNLKQFHEVLRYGAVPLTILERLVEEQARLA